MGLSTTSGFWITAVLYPKMHLMLQLLIPSKDNPCNCVYARQTLLKTINDVPQTHDRAPEHIQADVTLSFIQMIGLYWT